MSARGPSSNRGLRRPLIVFAVAGLSALTFSYFDRPARQPAKPLSQDVHPVERLGERARVAPILSPGVVRMDGTVGDEAPRHAAHSAYSARPPYRQPLPVEFRFLGKTTEKDETLVLLYGGGQTLTVRGTGPLDDDYAVDAIGDAYLVLRHVSLGESQIIQLAAWETTFGTGWAPENTPQD